MFERLQPSEIKELFLPARAWRTAVFLAVWLLAAGADAHAASFTASLDRDTITVGETVALKLTFEGGSPNVFPTLPLPQGFQITSHGTSEQVTMVNNEVSSMVSHVYHLLAREPGEFTIPEISAVIEGKEFKSQPLKVTVLKRATPPPAPPGQPAAGTSGAFLKLIVPRTEVYLGEVVPVEIQLYGQAGKLVEMPRFKEEGFTLGKMLQPAQSQTIVNNQRYSVLSFKTYVVPVKAGKLDLGPATMPLSVPSPNSRRTIFGELLDWQTVNLQSDPVTINALPLPTDNVPPGFKGAVGNLSMTFGVSPTNVAVGDPITVKVQISGQGGIEGIALADQPAWQQFKVYPPTSDFQPSDELGINGTKSFALTVVPESTEIRELPPFTFSFFDPNRKQYRTLTQPAVPLTVRPSAASLPPPVAGGAASTPESNDPPSRDIVHIKPRLGTLAVIQPPLALRPWFILMQGAPVLAWMSLLVARKQREKLAGNPRLRRQRHAELTVRNGLKELRKAADANQHETFYATLFRLLQEQIGERLDLPASAITESVVEERLCAGQIPQETVTTLWELFQACNQARYARQETNEELVSLVPKVESALEALRRITA